MFSISEPDEPLIATEDRRPSEVSALPWSWPEGSRILLAVLAIIAAIGLLVGKRAHSPDASRAEVAAVSELKLDPNTATPEALAALPYIGPTLARRIAEARADGPFRSPEDIRARVRGIGPATLARIEPHLRIEAAPQVAPGLDTRSIAIVDAGTDTAQTPMATSSRKPPRSRTRKAKGASVALAAKSAEMSPSP
jgi:competence protein ComEA